MRNRKRLFFWWNKPWPLDPEEPDDVCAEDYELCGEKWVKIIRKRYKGLDDSERVWYKLAKQWIAARLNMFNGACVPPDLVDCIVEVEALLEDTCEREFPPSAYPEFKELQKKLSDYNKSKCKPGDDNDDNDDDDSDYHHSRPFCPPKCKKGGDDDDDDIDNY